MNSVKITQHSLEDFETALILLQMATGLPTDEVEKKFESTEVIQNRFEKKSTPRVAAKKCIATMRSIVTTALNKEKSTKANDEITPAKKRGRPSLKNIVATTQPAKKPKIVPIEEKEEEIVPATAPSKIISQITVTPSTGKRNFEKTDDVAKWRTMRLNMMKESSARALEEHEVLEMLRMFFKDLPVNSYQPQFFQKFIRNA